MAQGRSRLLENRIEALENTLQNEDMTLEAMRLRGCSTTEIVAQFKILAPRAYQAALNIRSQLEENASPSDTRDFDSD